MACAGRAQWCTFQGWCWKTEEHIKNVTKYFISSGLAKLGYNQINIDEGWLVGRAANGSMVYPPSIREPG